MNEITSNKIFFLASVKEIPKNSPVLENQNSITNDHNTDCKLPESKIVRDNRREIDKSSHVSRTVPMTRIKNSQSR